MPHWARVPRVVHPWAKHRSRDSGISVVALSWIYPSSTSNRAYFKYSKIKSILNVNNTRGITPKRVTSGGAHLRSLTLGQHSSEETSQWWRAFGDTVPI